MNGESVRDGADSLVLCYINERSSSREICRFHAERSGPARDWREKEGAEHSTWVCGQPRRHERRFFKTADGVAKFWLIHVLLNCARSFCATAHWVDKFHLIHCTPEIHAQFTRTTWAGRYRLRHQIRCATLRASPCLPSTPSRDLTPLSHRRRFHADAVLRQSACHRVWRRRVADRNVAEHRD